MVVLWRLDNRGRNAPWTEIVGSGSTGPLPAASLDDRQGTSRKVLTKEALAAPFPGALQEP